VAKLIYSAIASLDGYVADEEGKFDWSAPDEEVHSFVNELERPIGTYLYGRRMYEVMAYWETADASPTCRRSRTSSRRSGRQRTRSSTQDAGDGVERQDADRARLRARSRPAAESDGWT
jgi:dihydrofolate reductase